jgi:FtsP/CotA-like multicopper oxidase with cupredoxin domain
MKTTFLRAIVRAAVVAVPLVLAADQAHAKIDGLTGTTFNVTAKADLIQTPDGGSILIWGYAPNDGTAQYPGPTFIVNQGDTITINLSNRLPIPVSMVFPGQEGVVASGGTSGLLTQEAPADNAATTVTYTFTATHAGTYTYSSGTRADLEVEMGLVGAIIVRPYGFNPAAPRAYYHPDSAYDREYLFFLTDMDPTVHDLVAAGLVDQVNTTTFWPVYWFANGRAAPDTMLDSYVPWLPTQPYNCFPRMHPGERVLMRVAGAGHDLHPFHQHGNHARVIARDGRLLETVPGVSGPDLSFLVFTFQSVPGETMDGIFEWTGENLGWDIYGHAPGDPLQPHEYAPDHGKPFPVVMPDNLSLTLGDLWSGSPFLGQLGQLPPGAGTQNLNGGYFYMWHSHTEKELTNFDIFPGGMMTFLLIEAPDVPITE